MKKTSSEYPLNLNVIIHSHLVKDFPSENRHELKIDFNGTKIKFGTIFQLPRPLPNKTNYIYVQENDPDDSTEIVASSLSAAIDAVIKMKLCL